MVRPLGHNGRPGTEVIPQEWAADHRPVAAGTMTGLCVIRTQGRWDNTVEPAVQALGDLVLGPDPVPCRAQRINREQTIVVGEQQTTLADYLLTLPYTPIEIEVGHIAYLQQLPADLGTDGELLIGKPLVVTAVGLGSILWERDLYVSLDQG
jgi:hypothetical protein